MMQRRTLAQTQARSCQPATDRSPLWSLLITGPLLLAALALLNGCAGDETAPPQQVQSGNPTVTYNYKGDQQLIKANQSAEVYCSNKYHSSAQSRSISDTPDGGKSAVFECVQNGATTLQAPGQTAIPGTAYSYTSDQELLDRTRNAESYCSSLGGGQHAVSNINNNLNGTRSVSFSCAATQQ